MDFLKRNGNKEFASQPYQEAYEPQLGSIVEPYTEQETSVATGPKGPAGQRIKRLKSGSRASRNRENSHDRNISRDVSRERTPQYTFSDLEKKIDNYERKKKKSSKSKEKRSRKQSRENSMTRSHKSGELAKRMPRLQRSMT